MCVRSIIIGLVVIGLALTGCSGQPETSSTEAGSPPTPGTAPAKDTSPVSSEILQRQVDLKALLDEYLPPLDGGRVELSVPRNWNVMSRSSSHLARFYTADINGPPRIEISVKDSPYAEFETVTDQNVAEFAQRVDQQLASENKKLVESVIPIFINGIPFARFVSDLGLKYPDGRSVTVERQVLQTIVARRLYTVELRVLPGTVATYRDQAYAVAASMKFHAKASPPPSVATEPPAPASNAEAVPATVPEKK